MRRPSGLTGQNSRRIFDIDARMRRTVARACVRVARSIAARAFRSRAFGPRSLVHARPPIARTAHPPPTGAQMNSDDSSPLPLAGATPRADSRTARCVPASVSAFTDPQPIAHRATRRDAPVRR
jgi:hypothetical protein